MACGFVKAQALEQIQFRLRDRLQDLSWNQWWAVLAALRFHPARLIPLTSGLLINPQHCRTRAPSTVFCFLRPRVDLPTHTNIVPGESWTACEA